MKAEELLFPRLTPMSPKLVVDPSEAIGLITSMTLDFTTHFRPVPIGALEPVGHIDTDCPTVDYMTAHAARWDNGQVLVCLYQVYHGGKHQHFAGYFVLHSADQTGLESVVIDYIVNKFRWYEPILRGQGLVDFIGSFPCSSRARKRTCKDFGHRIDQFLGLTD